MTGRSMSNGSRFDRLHKLTLLGQQHIDWARAMPHISPILGRELGHEATSLGPSEILLSETRLAINR